MLFGGANLTITVSGCETSKVEIVCLCDNSHAWWYLWQVIRLSAVIVLVTRVTSVELH